VTLLAADGQAAGRDREVDVVAIEARDLNRDDRLLVSFVNVGRRVPRKIGEVGAGQGVVEERIEPPVDVRPECKSVAAL
jgi:hypothetical protein